MSVASTATSGAAVADGSAAGESFLELDHCPGPDICRDCFWWQGNGGRCGGCERGYHGRCLKRTCHLECYSCSGGKLAYTPGCCGRAVTRWPVWRDRLREILERPLPSYSPPPVRIRCRLIPVIYGQKSTRGIADAFPRIDAWAVPIHKVASRQGRFRSRDLKDYLGIPADRKLILSTCAPDDYQEMLWNRRQEPDFREHGFDYWFPAHFSIYDSDSRLYQFLSARRQQIHALATGSRFVWFRQGETVPLDFMEPIRGAGSVLISTQETEARRSLAMVAEEVRAADGWFPARSAFFFVGGRRGLEVSPGRRTYEVNSRWLMLGLRGRDLRNRPVPEMARREVLTANLREVVSRLRPSYYRKDTNQEPRR